MSTRQDGLYNSRRDASRLCPAQIKAESRSHQGWVLIRHSDAAIDACLDRCVADWARPAPFSDTLLGDRLITDESICFVYSVITCQ